MSTHMPDNQTAAVQAGPGGCAHKKGGWARTDSGAAETSPCATWSLDSDARPVLLVEQLFAANYLKLAGWVRHLVDDDDTAYEIAPEAFARLLAKWTNPANPGNPLSYLYKIATSLVRVHWRKTARERRAMRSVTANRCEPASDPAQDVEVLELIQRLPTRMRAA